MMTAHRGLFVRQTGTAPTAVGTTPVEARLALAGLYAENAPGVPRQGLLAQSAVNVVIGTGTMSYDVAPVNPVVTRALGDGVHTPTFTGITNVLTADAPASGSRIDLIWVKQNDAEAGDANNFPDLGVTQGMAAPTPSRPTASLPPGAYVIASAVVSAGAVATTDATVVITQEWVHTAARGAPILVRSVAERDIMTPFPGLTVKRLDARGWVEVWDGATWRHPHPFAEAAGYTTVASINAGATGTAVATFPPGLFTQPPIVQVLPESYRLVCGTSIPTTSSAALVAYNATTVFTGQSVRIHWRAVQMTPTSAAG